MIIFRNNFSDDVIGQAVIIVNYLNGNFAPLQRAHCRTPVRAEPKYFRVRLQQGRRYKDLACLPLHQRDTNGLM